MDSPTTREVSSVSSVEGLVPRSFELLVHPGLVDFDRIEVATTTQSKGGEVPLEVDVIFSEGRRLRQKADAPVFLLAPADLDTPEIVVTIERAEHIKRLHMQREESGSGFPRSKRLVSIFEDICQRLPTDASIDPNGTGAWAVEIDMEEVYGYEGLASLDELIERGTITEHDRQILGNCSGTITLRNAMGNEVEMAGYVNFFNGKYSDANIFLDLIRDRSVIVPHVVAKAHPTSRVMLALTSSRDGRRTFVTTCTPGRAMDAFPRLEFHRYPDGQFNMHSFYHAAGMWTEHAMLVPTREVV